MPAVRCFFLPSWLPVRIPRVLPVIPAVVRRVAAPAACWIACIVHKFARAGHVCGRECAVQVVSELQGEHGFVEYEFARLCVGECVLVVLRVYICKEGIEAGGLRSESDVPFFIV